ncbi:hypothetical protein V5O48_008401 [Marasmius crinis-equi]|uniref:Uncharacterized protein n=1 Tax=Marasmius crinis-equi TaxID=585013 RepID=A0ABR3FEF1_9AGAR
MADRDSAPVAPDTQRFMISTGELLAGDLVTLTCESGLWAIYLVLFIWALRLQLPRTVRNPSVASVSVLAVTVFLFASSTALWGLQVVDMMAAIKQSLLVSSDVSLHERAENFNQQEFLTGVTEEVLFMANMIVGDSVVIWRAWVICKNTRLQKLVWIPITIILVSLAFAIIAMNCLAGNGFVISSSIAIGSRTCQWGEPIAWALSLCTNLSSTTLIAIRAWQHRHFLRANSANVLRNSGGHRILIILVESGFAYCLFWLTQLQLFFPSVQRYDFITFFHDALNAVGDQISGIYPTIIIILVNKQRSLRDVTLLELEESKEPKAEAPREREVSTLRFRSAGEQSETDLERGKETRLPRV